MLRSYDGIALRQLRTRRLRALLTAIGIVLGVGMVFGVLLLTTTIRHTFDDLIGSAWGSKDLIVQPSTAGYMSNDTLTKVEAVPGVSTAGAMVGAQMVRLNRQGRPIKGMPGKMMVAGYDPSGPPPYDFTWVNGQAPSAGRELFIEKNWARNQHVKSNDVILLGTPTGPLRFRVAGIFKFSNDLSFGGMGMAFMPLDEARKVMDIPAGWLQISVTAQDRTNTKPLQKRIQQVVGPGIDVKTPSSFSDDLAEQLQALDMVLYFFSGVALFVGGFLILNSFNMTVLQRTRELGMLRTLGATRRMVVRSVLLEALVLGVIGSLIGLGLGLALAAGLIQMMKGLGMPVGKLYIAGSSAIVAVVLGMVTTTLGAWRPAARAGRTEPIRAILGLSAPRSLPRPRRALLGVLLFLPGMIFGGSLWFGSNSQSTSSGLLAITLTMVMFAGMVMMAPFIITPVIKVLAAPLRRVAPTGGRLASDAVRTNPRRTAATAVALTIGLSVIVVNMAMSSSFLGTLRDQIDAAYARDVTVQTYGASVSQGGGTIAPSVRREIAALPAAGIVSPVRAFMVKLPDPRHKDQMGTMMGVDPATFGVVDKTPVKGATREEALRGLAAGGIVLGTGYAANSGLGVGDHLTIRGPEGARRVRVVGVLNAATSFQAHLIQMSIGTMDALYGRQGDNQLLIKARSDGQRAALTAQVNRLIDQRHPELEALSTGDVKDKISSEINRQFGLFNAIVGIAIIVSLLGVVNTLAMSVAERTRELGVLRALGSSRWLVRLSMIDESLLITLAGALAGLGLGLAIALVWVQALDSVLPGITFQLPMGTIVGVVIASVVAGVIAAALPARRAAKLDVIQALTYE